MGMGNEEDRIEHLDVAKGLAILCVIIGHMGWEYVDRIIYPFHMPLFLICSGYFISEQKEFLSFKFEKARRLLLPYMVTCIGMCILSLLANCVLGLTDEIVPDLLEMFYASFYGSCIDYRIPFFIKGIGQIWFLWALFWALLIVKYFEEKEEDVIIFVMAYIAYISSKYIWLPFSVQAGAVSAIFVWVGYKLKKIKFFSRKLSIGMALFGTAMWLFEAYFDIRVNLCNNTLDAGGLFSIVGSIAICFVVIQLAKLICRYTSLKAILNFYGRNSMLILCFHEMETFFFPWSIVYNVLTKMKIFGGVADIVVFMAKVIFSTVCTMIVLKIANKQLQILGFVNKEK